MRTVRTIAVAALLFAADIDASALSAAEIPQSADPVTAS
jgi:hypothetical protein